MELYDTTNTRRVRLEKWRWRGRRHHHLRHVHARHLGGLGRACVCRKQRGRGDAGQPRVNRGGTVAHRNARGVGMPSRHAQHHPGQPHGHRRHLRRTIAEIISADVYWSDAQVSALETAPQPQMGCTSRDD